MVLAEASYQFDQINYRHPDVLIPEEPLCTEHTKQIMSPTTQMTDTEHPKI